MGNSQEQNTNSNDILKNMRQSITFDIDTDVGNELLKDYHKAHYRIRRFLEKEKGFLHPQGSVYESPGPMTYAEARVILQIMLKKYPYLGKCIRDLRVTSILEEYICNDMLQYDRTAQMSNNPTQENNDSTFTEQHNNNIQFDQQEFDNGTGLDQEDNNDSEGFNGPVDFAGEYPQNSTHLNEDYYSEDFDEEYFNEESDFADNEPDFDDDEPDL